jgi:hypothetical protein
MVLGVGVDATFLKGKDCGQISAAFIFLEGFVVFAILVAELLCPLMSFFILGILSILFLIIHNVFKCGCIFITIVVTNKYSLGCRNILRRF